MAIGDAGIIFGVVGRVDDIRPDEQVLAAGQEKVPPCTAPAVGENSAEVLRAAGYDESEIQALRAAGVIG